MSRHPGRGELGAASKAQHRTERIRGDRANEVEPRHRGFEVRRENWRALDGLDLREQRIIKEWQTC